jgi:signal transduction histidine kinase
MEDQIDKDAQDDDVIIRELRIHEAVDAVAEMPYVLSAGCFAIVIPGIHAGPMVLWGWQTIPLIGALICSALVVRSYLKLRKMPRPKRVSRRRMRSLAIFSLVYGLCMATIFSLLIIQGDQSLQTLMMGLAIIGAGVTLGVNSINTSLYFAFPVLIVTWVTVIWVGLLSWPSASALFFGISSVVVLFAISSRAKTIELIKLTLANDEGLKTQIIAQEQLREAEAAAAHVEQERATENAQMQRNLIDAIAFPMVLSKGDDALEVTPQGRIDFGVPDGALDGVKLSSFFVNPVDQGAMIALLDAQNGVLDNYEVMMKDRDNNQFWCAVSMRPLVYGGENCWLNSIYIIDARKRMEQDLAKAKEAAEGALADLKTTQESLVHAEKMASLGELTAGIAHEIKNPLNFVNNFAKLSAEMMDELVELIEEPVKAIEDEDDRDDVEDILKTVKDNLIKIDEHGSRADSIVKNMLAHSRQGGAEKQIIKINALVEEAVNLAYHGARAADKSFNVTIEQEFDSANPEVNCLPQELQRVFLNLCGNAMYAAVKRDQPEGQKPTLTVSSKVVGTNIIFRVEDNGDGIPEDIREKIFQPFFTTKPTGEGTGLGLSMSFDIVKQHEGNFDLDSELGRGSAFSVTLPLFVKK